MLRFMLEDPPPSTIFCFALVHLRISVPERFYWLVPLCVRINNHCVSCRVKAKKWTKTILLTLHVA